MADSDRQTDERGDQNLFRPVDWDVFPLVTCGFLQKEDKGAP